MDLVVAPPEAGKPAGPRQSLEVALEAFQSILSDSQRRKLHDIGAIRDADTVMIFTAQLDRENQLRKGHSIASRLYSVLQSVQTFSAVVDTFVSSNPGIAALVWGSIKLTLLIVINYTSYFEALSGLFRSCSKQCPRFAEYQALYPASPRLQKALCDFHASIVRCCKHVVEAIQRPWQKQLWKNFHQSFHQEFKPDVDDIQRLGKEVKEEITFAKAHADRQDQKLQEKERMAASRQRSRLGLLMPKVKIELETIKELQLEQSTRRSREERQRLLQSLSSHDYITPFRNACEKRQSGTAKWILAAPEFTRWHDGTGSSLFWCSGKIGSGKTILCASVINHVYTKKCTNDRVVFFFLQHNNADSLRAVTIVRSLIRQSLDIITLPEDLEDQLRKLDRELYVELGVWVGLLQQIIEYSKTFYVFIDGLDECDAGVRRNLLGALSSLATTASNLRIFISGRNSVRLDFKGRFLHMEHVSMESDGLTSDIRLYIKTVLQERKRNEDLEVKDPCLLDEIGDKLAQHADGMFIWVTFLISEICAASCDDDIRRSLRNLPKDLEDTFTRALSRIESRQKRASLAQKVFKWVAVAKRPLTLEELQQAISIDPGQKYSRPDRLVRDLSGIVLWCENLLQVNEELQSVQFAHTSVYDFITKASLPPQLAGFHVDLDEADHLAGEICITYLHFNDFKTTVARRLQPLPQINPMTMASTAISPMSRVAGFVANITDLTSRRGKAKAEMDLVGVLANCTRTDARDNLVKLQQSHPFLEYAAMHWIFHTAQFQETKSTTWGLWRQIITSGHNLAQIPWRESESSSRQCAMIAWSHQAHHYALLRYVNSLGDLSESKREKLIKVSASECDIEAIEILLEPGRYSIQISNIALKIAAGSGHLQIVDRLLSAGADVNAAAAEVGGQTALQAASGGGHLQIVDRLLSAGADVNAAAGRNRGRTALQAASGGGHLQIVDRLLSAGADVNAAAAEVEGRTALQAASYRGHLQIVDRLLSALAK